MTDKAATSVDLASELAPDSLETPQWFQEVLCVPRREGYIESGGCQIHYFSWGNPENPGVLLAHGFVAHARCFAFIAPFLANDYYLVAYDHSGMGDSGSRESYTDEVRIQEMLDVAEQTGLFDGGRRPAVVAHSFGGGVGLMTMEQAHERFAGLVICDLMTLRPERLVEHGRERENSRGDSADEPAIRPNRVYPTYEAAKARFVLSPPQPVNEACLFDYMAFHSMREVDGGWTWKFDPGVFAPNTDLHQRLLRQGKRIAEAPGKVVIVYGKESALFDDDSADYVAECGGGHIPMIGIPHARHHLMLDQPVAFASVLRAVLVLL